MIIDKKLLYVNKDNQYNQESSSDTNLFRYSLQALIESNDIIIKKLTEEAYVTEAWGDGTRKVFNFYGILDAIIGAFVNIIEKLIGKFLSLLVYLAGQGKAFDIEARAFGSKIQNYHRSFTLDNIYKFTNLEPDVFPDSGLANHFSDSLNTFIIGFNNAIEGSSNSNNVMDRIEDVSVSMRDKLNSFRCYLLDIPDSGDIMSDEIFGQYCFTTFRDNMDRPYNTATFNGPTVFEKVYKPYLENKKLQAQTKRKSREIQDACRNAKKKLQKFTPDISKFTSEDSANIMKVYNDIQRNICTLFDYECKDVVTLFGAKLQAYKDCYVQSRRIIMKCMQEIVENKPFENKREGEW